MTIIAHRNYFTLNILGRNEACNYFVNKIDELNKGEIILNLSVSSYRSTTKRENIRMVTNVE